jgi:hypothetical protein
MVVDLRSDYPQFGCESQGSISHLLEAIGGIPDEKGVADIMTLPEIINWTQITQMNTDF